MPITDDLVDAPIAAIADLLERSIVAKWGREALAEKAVFTHPISVAQLMNRMPALVVMRDTDRVDPDDDVSDNEVVTVIVEYYLPATPPDRMRARWAFLRAVWKRVHSRLHAGFDPLVLPHHMNVAKPGEPEWMVPVLAAHGWRVPERPVANVKYNVSSEGTDPIPWFRAVVTMRTSEQFDWTFGGTYAHDDLEGIDGETRVIDPEPGDPPDDPHTEPGFTSIIDF